MEAIQQNLNPSKMIGADRIKNKMLKLFTKEIAPVVTKLFNKILNQEITLLQIQWNLSEIIPLCKKGDKSDINNYCLVCLTSNMAKVFSKALRIVSTTF